MLQSGQGDMHGEHFGGESRNPNREAYIFDAKWNPGSAHLVSLALSDGTLRILDTRADATSSLILPSVINNTSEGMDQAGSVAATVKLGHATSLNWNNKGGNTDLCSITFGSGHIALLDMRKMELVSIVKMHSKACYGTLFLPTQNKEDDASLLSWSSDSTIAKWSLGVNEEQTAKEIVMDNYMHLPDLSVMTCAFQPESRKLYCGGESCLSGVPGNHKKPSFMGTPIYIFDQI